MFYCYICGCLLDNNNRTEEHIIPNALGGRLKSKNLICKQCNSAFGVIIDSELAKQFNFVANMLNIKRDRGAPQPFDAVDCRDGTVYSLEPGGVPVLKYPVIKKQLKENTVRFSIRAGNAKQWHSVAKGLKRNYPEIDENKIFAGCKIERKYLDNEITFKAELGGSEVFRSLCKSAVSFYLYNNGVLANVSHLIPYITGQIDDKRIVKPVYFEQDPIPQKDSEVLHSIIIKGDSREKLLYAYIELFDFYKVLVLLNENYSDDSVEFSYFFDVISRKEVFKGYQLDLTRMDVERIMSGVLPYKDILQHLNVLLEKTLRKQDSEHRKMLLTEAMNNVMKKYPEKKYFDEEMRKDIVNETMKQLTPWLLYRLRLNKS